ncbi:zinc ribbon domain-containing protein [Cupriavidus basilensis]
MNDISLKPSCCTSRTGPAGLQGLSLRDWTCSACQTRLDRDVNAARNILRMGLSRMEEAFAAAAGLAAVNKALSEAGGRTCSSCRRNLRHLGWGGRKERSQTERQ